ncbi:MAG: proline/betaine ABC transporter permease ProW, partial [Proteobacteria bacterium]|nr:proline/betaine ABC transporter permease ProW [Pseudomonadota bacterium]
MSETSNDPWSAATSAPAAADAAANPYQAADAALNPYEAAPPPPGSDAWLS